MKKTFYYLLTKSVGTYINILFYIFPNKAIQIAHSHFSEPKKGKITVDDLPKTLQTATLETILDNENIIQTYIWKGNKTIILLIHGWESNSSRWKKMLPYLLESGSTIIAIDGPGQGLSNGKEFTVPKYAEFIDIVSKKYQPQYIIGHSLGGKTSLYFQYKYQSPTIQKMVILGAPSDFLIILKNFTNLLSLNQKVIKELEKKYRNILEVDLTQFASKQFAKKLKVAGLLAHDVDDTIVLFSEAKKIAAAWQDVQFEQTQGLGHKLHDADLYRKVSDFLFDKTPLNLNL
ncbi:Pimeloyl-ACP methyl ester carboxylesterase [Flavobacterium segetis]|uniref:Pimeloyl-ACP methyl ester carboxylesterase n=1 Tax=Flavobacterium segetis TaxID=271157 RepID=A0A1M5ELS7_9FLAO|nr:alpha/beta hydrolase [Flavobacterium segetis]SHF80263.1 Pimeloyl-ACP methyl ester carboxylesterase [Flavobacterium segetis]